jgi:pimeloyl-ACP methyl ester carboxylesterase
MQSSFIELQHLIYILGRDDGFINSVAYKKALVDAGLAASQIHLLDHVRHVPQLDDPELCAKLIIEFVEQIQDKTWAIKAQKAEQM